jgi:hypothetical protein
VTDSNAALPATASHARRGDEHRGNAVYEGARVVLESSGSADPEATAQTDSNGAFSFANLAPGAFKLTVSARGFLTQSISGVLRRGRGL